MRMPIALTQKGASTAVVTRATVEVAWNVQVRRQLLACILDIHIPTRDSVQPLDKSCFCVAI